MCCFKIFIEYFRINLKKEQVFATHLEEALSQISLQFPHLVCESDVEHHLQNCLFYGMVKTSWDIIHYLYDDTKLYTPVGGGQED